MEISDIEMIPMVVFEINKKEFGISVYSSHEVIIPPPITEMPNTPEFVLGVINLRGIIISIIDMRKLFNFPATSLTTAKIILVNIHDIPIGMVVDTVHEVVKINRTKIEAIPNIANWEGKQNCLIGIAKENDRMITLLNLDKILSEEQLELFK